MCDRDKLMKLCDTKIENMHFVNSDHWFDFSQKIEELVDYLISNGVTVTNVGCKSEWISVEEKLPDCCGMPVLMVAVNQYSQTSVVKGFTDYQCPITFHTNEKEYDGVWKAWDVTHWMPLPEPPTEKEN